jgi:adenine-specific DNA-methyltransferase
MPPRTPVEKQSPDLKAEWLASLEALFPEGFAEGKVDWDRLRAALGDLVDERPERYTFTWAGKRDAIRLLQTPTAATLAPCPEESVDFDTTRNLFIEGDNLEVLKLLYKAYFGRVKMIYIDPPYNTGNDFIYPDNYADPLATYLQLTGQQDAEGNLLSSNPETSGRYHSAWLAMMYPRLFLARQLLREDGVIFVSIDDHEVHNLRLLMNEVFGEENLLAQLVWKSRKMVDNRTISGISVDHEYVICYGKSREVTLRGSEKDLSKFSNPDDDPRGPWRSADLTGLVTKDRRPNLHYDLPDPATGIVYPCPPKGWRFDPAEMRRRIDEGRVLFPQDGRGRPRHKLFLNEMKSLFTGFSSIVAPDVFTQDGTKELLDLFGKEVIQFPKPLGLIRQLLRQSAAENDLVVDFFAGSATTAQALLDLNREDNGSRRFVMVQLPEPTGRQDYPTIAEIGKERIRRVIARMKEEDEGRLDLSTRDAPEDLGFRVFKLARSHYRPWQGVDGDTPEAYAAQMALFTDPLVEGWTVPGVIWEVALKEGFDLASRVERVASLAANAVYRVTDEDKDQSLTICLDEPLDADTLSTLNLTKEDLFVCRDTALDDALAANLALQCRLKTI